MIVSVLQHDNGNLQCVMAKAKKPLINKARWLRANSYLQPQLGEFDTAEDETFADMKVNG